MKLLPKPICDAGLGNLRGLMLLSCGGEHSYSALEFRFAKPGPNPAEVPLPASLPKDQMMMLGKFLSRS